MGLLSKFEGKMEDTVEGAAEIMGSSSLSPVQIAKKAEKTMLREKMVGAGKQYAPTLYTILISPEDDQRLSGYYPTLAGETETYLAAKAAESGLVMDGQPLVRFITDENLKRGKVEVIAEMVASPIIAQLRQEEMEYYGIEAPAHAKSVAPISRSETPKPTTTPFGEQNNYRQNEYQDTVNNDVYLYDITNDRAFTLTGYPMVIGRDSRSDIVLPDSSASRTHAEIRLDASGTWILSDLGSTNGTYVNGRKIKSIPLRDADHITIGTTELEFQIL